MLFAYLLPALSLALNKRPALGLFLLVLQPTIVGWIIGILIAPKNLRRQRRRRRHRGAPAY
jgi:hypothetical protein